MSFHMSNVYRYAAHVFFYSPSLSVLFLTALEADSQSTEISYFVFAVSLIQLTTTVYI